MPPWLWERPEQCGRLLNPSCQHRNTNSGTTPGLFVGVSEGGEIMTNNTELYCIESQGICFPTVFVRFGKLLVFAATYSHIKRNASSNGGTTPPTRWIIDHILKDLQRRYFLLQALSNARHYLHSDPIYSTYFTKHTCLPPPRTSSVKAYTMVKYMLLSLPIVPLSEASPKC